MDKILQSIESKIKECESSKYPKSEFDQIEMDLFLMGKSLNGFKMFDESLTCFLRCLDIQRKLSNEQDNQNIALTLLWIGQSYENLNKYDEAIKYYNESLQICYPETKWCAVNGIAKCLFHQEKLDEALNKFKESYETAQNETDQSDILYNIGRVYEKKEMYVEALDYFSRSLEILQRVSPLDHKQLRTLFYYIGKMYYKLEDCEKALSYLKRALDEFGKSEVDSLIENIRNTIGLTYKKLGDFEEALKYLNGKQFLINLFISIYSIIYMLLLIYIKTKRRRKIVKVRWRINMNRWNRIPK